VPIERPAIEPIRTDHRVQFLSDGQLDRIQEATFQIMEDVGVKFPSAKALSLFADHGARVDHDTQIVRIPRDLVYKGMATVPRYFNVGARVPSYDFYLEDGVTYFCTDGCGVETVDFETRQRRASCKADVGRMARVADYLSSMAFYWPMVSAQDCGRTASLHELDASWNNTVKHVQSVTLMGAAAARYAVEMATVVAGDEEELRRRPLLSLIVCTVAPLVQDEQSLESAMVLAEAGLPLNFLAMPTLGTTSPATFAGSLAVGDAEVVSGTVLMQLANPGARVSHSIMHAWADPRSGGYVAYPTDCRCRFAPVEMAHRWQMPAFGGAFGTESHDPGTWQAAADVALDPLLSLYHRARYALARMEVNDETLALDAIRDVGPAGHFLAQRHTREHMRSSAERLGITHEMDAQGNYRDPLTIAREKLSWILDNHQPEPLEKAKQAELTRILRTADRELNK
jgi:trimethylamine--corrinoid protein Co-methyltransferase